MDLPVSKQDPDDPRHDPRHGFGGFKGAVQKRNVLDTEARRSLRILRNLGQRLHRQLGCKNGRGPWPPEPPDYDPHVDPRTLELVREYTGLLGTLLKEHRSWVALQLKAGFVSPALGEGTQAGELEELVDAVSVLTTEELERALAKQKAQGSK